MHPTAKQQLHDHMHRQKLANVNCNLLLLHDALILSG